MNSFRPVLEVLKFLSDVDILRNANFVSSKWKDASDSQELWTTFSESFALTFDFPLTKVKYQELLAASNLFIKTTTRSEIKYHVYNCIRDSRKDVLVSKKFNLDLTAATLVSGGKIVFCGGMSRLTYIYSSETKVIRKLENMNAGRRNSGVISDSKDLYVFGGEYRESYLSSSEKLNLSTLKWEKLPDMLAARRGMKPCYYHGMIYLCGGAKVRESIKHEKFDIARIQFTQLSLNLPRTSITLLTFLQDELLVIITSESVWRYNTESLKCMEKVPHQFTDKYSLEPLGNPVVVQQCVFYANFGEVYKLDMKELTRSVCFRTYS